MLEYEIEIVDLSNAGSVDEVDGILFTGGTDIEGGDVLNTPFLGEAYVFDHVSPSVTAITTSAAAINDFNVGKSALTLTAAFSEPMDQTVTPTFSFPSGNDPSSAFSKASGHWVDSQHYAVTYDGSVRKEEPKKPCSPWADIGDASAYLVADMAPLARFEPTKPRGPLPYRYDERGRPQVLGMLR